jgi:outer membrane immunogenic protein
MKRFVFAIVATAAVGGSAAGAADMPLKAPPLYGWTGWYIGGEAGYAWSNSNTVETRTANITSIPPLNGNVGAAIAAQGTGSVTTDSNRFIGGLELGYNWRVGGLVYGLETDIRGLGGSHDTNAVTIAGSVPGAVVPISSIGTIASSNSVSYLGTLRGRFGVLATPTSLIYATGGLAYGEVKTTTAIVETLGFSDTPGPFGTTGSTSATRAGWTVGAGAEWQLWAKWSAKLEYRYYNLGNVTNTLPSIQQFGFFGSVLDTVSASQSTTRFSGSDISVGLNYHL